MSEIEKDKDLKLMTELQTFEEMIAGTEYEKTVYQNGKVEISLCNEYYERFTFEFSAEGKFLSIY